MSIIDFFRNRKDQSHMRKGEFDELIDRKIGELHSKLGNLLKKLVVRRAFDPTLRVEKKIETAFDDTVEVGEYLKIMWKKLSVERPVGRELVELSKHVSSIKFVFNSLKSINYVYEELHKLEHVLDDMFRKAHTMMGQTHQYDALRNILREEANDFEELADDELRLATRFAQ